MHAVYVKNVHVPVLPMPCHAACLSVLNAFFFMPNAPRAARSARAEARAQVSKAPGGKRQPTNHPTDPATGSGEGGGKEEERRLGWKGGITCGVRRVKRRAKKYATRNKRRPPRRARAAPRARAMRVRASCARAAGMFGRCLLRCRMKAARQLRVQTLYARAHASARDPLKMRRACTPESILFLFVPLEA